MHITRADRVLMYGTAFLFPLVFAAMEFVLPALAALLWAPVMFPAGALVVAVLFGGTLTLLVRWRRELDEPARALWAKTAVTALVGMYVVPFVWLFAVAALVCAGGGEQCM